MYLLMKALEELESRGLLVALEHLAHWSDGAPSYRSRSALSYMADHIPMRFKLSTVAKFGVAKHLKGASTGGSAGSTSASKRKPRERSSVRWSTSTTRMSRPLS